MARSSLRSSGGLAGHVFLCALLACGTDSGKSTAAGAGETDGAPADQPAPDGAAPENPLSCGPDGVPFAAPGGYTLALSALGTVFPAPGAAGNALAGQQNAGFGLDVLTDDGTPIRKMFVTFSQHDDVADAVQHDAVVVSTDGARTFGSYRAGVMSSPSFALQIRDGRVLSFGFVPTAVANDATGATLTLGGEESGDEGKTWKAFTAKVRLPKLGGSIGRLSGHPIQLGDGTILLAYYGRYLGDKGAYRAELLASTDAGRTFVRRGSIAVPPAGANYPEADVVELQDGSLYSVFRHHEGNDLSPLRWARSTDAGATWSTPKDVLIPLDGRAAAPRVGISPRLVMAPNGSLVLSSGRNDNFAAVSSGTHPVEWREAKVTYVNYPSATTAGYGQNILRVHGSSGNTGLEILEANRVVQFGDNCANGWGCPSGDSGHTIDNKNRVWRRMIDVLTPDVGKIDLLSKFQRRAIRVTTDMTWASTAHPRARVEGAFDGSNEYWSSAVKRGAGSGELTVALDHVYELTRIGLSIRRSSKGSARVYTSIDGVSFCPAPIAEAVDRTHRAIEYFSLSTPVRAAFVKVVTETSACDAELGEACSFLNELELYSTIDSFENDPVGGAPRGYSDVNDARVVDDQAGDTRRVLRLTDTSESSIARVVREAPPADRKTLEFAVRPLALTSAFVFTLTGRDAAGAALSAFHLAVMPDGRLHRYVEASGTWIPFSAPGAVAIGRWSRLRVEATLQKATLSVDGVVVGDVPPSAPGAAVLDGHSFASGGTKPKGDDVLLDDVYFR